ncbi:MAG: hypothetical protein AB8B55_06945 [Mariniblastus sp.]
MNLSNAAIESAINHTIQERAKNTQELNFMKTQLSPTRPFANMFLVLILPCLILVTGCGPRLATTKTIELQSNDIRTILIDAISSEQTVSVTAKADSKFSLHVHLAGDEDAVDAAAALGKSVPEILAQSVDQLSADLKFVVPAGKEGALRFSMRGPAPVKVQYTISN